MLAVITEVVVLGYVIVTSTLVTSSPNDPETTWLSFEESTISLILIVGAVVSISKLSSLVVCVFPALSRDVALTV